MNADPTLNPAVSPENTVSLKDPHPNLKSSSGKNLARKSTEIVVAVTPDSSDNQAATGVVVGLDALRG